MVAQTAELNLIKLDPDSLSENLLYAASAPTLSVDTEGNALDVREKANPDGFTMGISLGHRSAAGGLRYDYYPLRHMYDNLSWENFQPALRRIIENHPRIVMHNAKHDIAALANLGIKVPRNKYYDTMLGVTWINEELPSKRLDYVSQHYGGQPKNRSQIMQDIIDDFGWGYIPSTMIADYARNDAKITLELDEKIMPTFTKEGYDGPLWERERRFLDLIMKMEALGVRVDTDVCEKEIFIGKLKMEEVRHLLDGRNPSSNKDLYQILIVEMGLPILKETDKGNPSFDAEAMKEYELILSHRNNDTARLVLEYRGWQKTVSSNYQAYLDLLSPDGNLRCNYKLHGTKTTRLSCELPNLQQIPRVSENRWNGLLKQAFIAREGYTLWEADFSNLEMRVSAVYSQDPSLLATFRSGRNFFDDMEVALGRPRHLCKTLNYSINYGAGPNKVKSIFDITYEEACRMIDQYYRTYPQVRFVSNRAGSLAKHRGYVKMWTGRRRHFGDPNHGYKAYNSIIQGGAAEIVKSVMLALSEVIDWDECKMLLTIHDSVVFEIATGYEQKWLPIIREVMENVRVFNDNFGTVPFPVDMHRFGMAA